MSNDNFNELAAIKVKGMVLVTDITDPDNTKVLLDDKNAIHAENMSQSIANALAANVDSQNKSVGAISLMNFGRSVAL